MKTTSPMMFMAACLLFVLPSAAFGAIHGQKFWSLLVNSASFSIFVIATTSTIAVLNRVDDLNLFLKRLKYVCLAFMIIHFLEVVILRHGIDISTSRFEILSATTIPASAIMAIGIVIRPNLLELGISVSNLILMLLSVTRTLLAAFVGQLFCLFLAVPTMILNSRVIKKGIMTLLLIAGVISVDLLMNTGISERWITRLSAKERVGADPTLLTRLAEVHFMMDSFVSSPQTLLFGNGLAAGTKLTGPAADLAGSLVGFGSVLSVHGEGYGHNNHASMLFIGGLFFGAPLLFLLFLNGLQGILLIRKALLVKKDLHPAIIYISLSGKFNRSWRTDLQLLFRHLRRPPFLLVVWDWYRHAVLGKSRVVGGKEK